MKKIFCGDIPSMCGYGLKVYAFSEKEATKILKREFYKLRKDYEWNKDYHIDFYTFENAMDYFGGGVFEIEVGTRYDEGWLQSQESSCS